MVSGWDKFPGPNNDYASRGLGRVGTGRAIVLVFVFIALAILLFTGF